MDSAEFIEKFENFIDSQYRERLDESIRVSKYSIIINFKKLVRYDPEIASYFLENPETCHKNFQVALFNSTPKNTPKFIIRVDNIPKTEMVPIRNIRSRHLNKLILVEGNVKNRSTVKSQIEEAKFECPSCGNIITVLQLETTYREPTRCNCGRKAKFELLSKTRSDIQYISVEEPYEDIGEDSVPQRIGILLKDDLTDPEYQNNYIPGKPILVSGELKEVPIIKNGKKSRETDWIIEANYVKCLEDSLTKTTFTDKEIKEFVKLSKKTDLYEKLIDSVAPEIEGNREFKEAMLLFIVKGVRKVNSEGKSTREYFHILLMGDPSSGKSALGNEIELLSWRSTKVVGRGVSGPGLTASAERDPVLDMRVLQAGALPICNEGHIVVDEVDKMEAEVQSQMHSAMEDGIIAVNKATVQGILKARTSVFMIGNPKFGRYDPYESLISQINLPQPLVTRFDLIFPVKDEAKPDRDRRVATAIFNKHRQYEKANSRPIELRMLKNYLCYVSMNIKPSLSDEVEKILKDYFCKLRSDVDKKNSGNKNKYENIGIAPRQLEGLIRMTEASAKIHMRNEANKEDAMIAIKLFDYSMRCFGIDPETNKFDIDRFTTGVSASQRSKISQVKEIILDLSQRYGKAIPVSEIETDAQAVGFKLKEVEKLINKLRRAGDIFEHKPGYISKI